MSRLIHALSIIDFKLEFNPWSVLLRELANCVGGRQLKAFKYKASIVNQDWFYADNAHVYIVFIISQANVFCSLVVLLNLSYLKTVLCLIEGCNPAFQLDTTEP